MPVDRIKKVSSASALRAATSTSVPLAYASDTDQFHTKTEAGTAKTLVDTDSVQTLTNKTLGGGGGALFSKEVTFTETAGAGVYTGSVTVPAGATLIDVIVHAVALWDNAGTAAMIVGDVADPNGIFDAIDLKATDLLAAESLSISKAGGQEGVDVVATHFNRRYLATARVITGEITTSGAGGSTGRTRMTVIYSAPVAADITAATKA